MKGHLDGKFQYVHFYQFLFMSIRNLFWPEDKFLMKNTRRDKNKYTDFTNLILKPELYGNEKMKLDIHVVLLAFIANLVGKMFLQNSAICKQSSSLFSFDQKLNTSHHYRNAYGYQT